LIELVRRSVASWIGLRVVDDYVVVDVELVVYVHYAYFHTTLLGTETHCARGKLGLSLEATEMLWTWQGLSIRLRHVFSSTMSWHGGPSWVLLLLRYLLLIEKGLIWYATTILLLVQKLLDRCCV
jgi:hypothetical protein